MPFSKDIRTGFCDIKLNSAWIHTEIIDMGYTELESTEWDKYFEAYMIVLEKDFDYYLNAERKCDFDEWFMDNYYNNEFEPVFEKIEDSKTSYEEENLPKLSCKTETTMPTKMSEWLIEQMNALESGTLDADKTELILSFLNEYVEDPHVSAVFEKFKAIRKEGK